MSAPARRRLGMYPTYVALDPGFARELLAGIMASCKAGLPLNDEEREYLADCIGKILRGVDPKRAFYLTRRLNRLSGGVFAERNRLIFNRAQQLIAQGKSRNAAYAKVATEPLAAKRRGRINLSAKAIERICTDIERLVVPKRLARGD